MSKTTSGFEFNIDERVKTDWDFLEMVGNLQKNPSDLSMMKGLFIKLLGEKGFEKLKKHIKEQNDGFCPVEVLSKEFTEIVQSTNEIKK